MIVALTLALFASTSVGSPANPPTVARSHDDPPIQVSLNSENTFTRGQRARVYIRAAEDGYVVVLRADGEGRVRVLFPLDPNDDAVTPGGRQFEVRSRGDREAFTVDESEGTGVVLAAWSATPFAFDGLVRGGHWDPRALGAQQSDADREAALVEVVQSMAGDNHFDYDMATYTVQSVTAYNGGPDNGGSDNGGTDNGGSANAGPDNGGSYNGGSYYDGPYPGPWYGPGYSGLSLSFGFGSHWRYGRVGFGTFCDGYYWSTWGCGPFYDPFFYPVVYRPYGYRPYIYRSYAFGAGRFGGYSRRSYIGRNRGSTGFRTGSSWSNVQPRLRSPSGGGFSSGTRVSGSPSGSFNRGSARAPTARSAPSAGSSRGGWGGVAAPRSSGPGYSRGGGGYSRGGGGYSASRGGYSRGGGGGGGRRDGGGGGGGRRR